MHVELELGSGWTEKAAHISNAPRVRVDISLDFGKFD
jgi:hypothetical protein